MAMHPKGELVPIGGGDAIPLTREVITVGRRESCDVCLKFQNVSSNHCEFSFKSGVWYVRDMGSQNGTKVNGERVMKRLLRPGDQIGIASHKFTIDYQLSHDARVVMEEVLNQEENVFSQSLMEKAGLSKPRREDD
jgi:pSer/pThr/pTyr-binding forkhead associated (FHA) protein